MKALKSILAILALIVAMPTFAQFTTGGNSRGGNSGYTEASIEKGYRGFLDLGYGIGVGDVAEGRIEVSTAHGYQFNQYFFAGVGVGFNYFHDGSSCNLPIFADFRGTMPLTDSKIAPFLDFKVGYSVLDVEGFYCSPSIGIRVATSGKSGFNIGLGYEVQKFDAYWSKLNAGAVTIKVGLDF